MAQQDFIRNIVNPILATENTKKYRANLNKNSALYIVDKDLIYDANINVVGMDRASADKCWQQIKTAMEAQELYTKTKKREDWDRIDNFRKTHGYSVEKYAYAISTYDAGTAKVRKIWNDFLYNYDTKKFQSGTEQQKITNKIHAGHGNIGLAVSGVRALHAISELSKDAELAPLVQKLVDQASQQKLTRSYYSETEYRQFTHDMVIDEHGNISKQYVIVLSGQVGKENLKDSAEETLVALRDIIKADLPNLTSSVSLKQGIEGVLIYNLLRGGSKGIKYKGAAKRKKVVAHNKANKKITTKVPVDVGKMTKVPTNKPRPRQNSGPPINLVALINAKLPEEIRKRMTYPRLQWRTGRFAGSVRALSAEGTRNGGVTVGYTYQRNPYELFEPGRSSLATPARDPKQLIDLSIRAIAQQYVQGRFYTRRM